MCLIKGLENQACSHQWCRMAAKKPEFFGLFKSDYVMNREGVQSFELSSPVMDGMPPHILPVNPYPADSDERRRFEIFRQSNTTVAEAFGEWPVDRVIFDKSEVEFVMVEEIVSVPVRSCINDGGNWIDTVDLKEVAVYIGKGSINYQNEDFEEYASHYDYDLPSLEARADAKNIDGVPLIISRQLSPKAMALEGKNPNTSISRRSELLDAFKRGLKVMRDLNVQSHRILFLQYDSSPKIEIYFD